MKRMSRLLMLGLLLSEPVLAEAPPCAQIDLSKKDVDNMPFCPDVVKTNSAFSVYRCALQQTTKFNKPTQPDRDAMDGFLGAWKAIRDTGKSKGNAEALLGFADKLKLQVCRVKEAEDNTYLVAYTKPGIKDYSGPFMILRETKASRIAIQGGHDDTDGTFQATKWAIQHSHALAAFTNGHMRGKVPECSTTCGGPDDSKGRGDFVHDSVADNLGTYAIGVFGKLYPKRIHFQVHGQSNPKTHLYRVRGGNKVLANAWEKATGNATGLKAFNPRFQADFTTEPLLNSNWYIKVEHPANIHRQQPEHLAKAYTELETYPWAWDESEATTGPEEPIDLQATSDAPQDEEPALSEDPTPDDTPDEQADQEESDGNTTGDTNPTTWKPKLHRFQGEHDYICLVVKYNSGPSASASKCSSLAKSVAQFYGNQSHGLLKFHPRVETINVNFPPGPKGGGEAASIARRKFPHALLAEPRLWYHNNSNAGMRLANLTGYGNALHETGHLLGLGHAGRYMGYDPDNESNFGKLQGCGDGGSTMSCLRGGHLAVSQLIRLNWLTEGPSGYQVWDGTAPKEFELRKVNQVNGTDGLLTVVIPAKVIHPELDPGEGRDLYIGFSDNCQNDPCLVAYLAANGGSQRLGIFGKRFYNNPWKIQVDNLGFARPGVMRVRISHDIH